MQWIEIARDLGVTLDTLLTWSAHINQVGRRAADRSGMRGLLLNRSDCPYKQYAAIQAAHPFCDGLRMSDLAVLDHTQKCCNPSKCLRVATNATWYVSSRQIQEDLGIMFFADDIRALIESFDLKTADARNPLIWQLRRHLCLPRAD
jgi:hypothetical protein